MERLFGFAKELVEKGVAVESEVYGTGNLYDLTIQQSYDVDFYREVVGGRGALVLELGCGSGRLLKPLCEAGFQVSGLDLSPIMLQQAREILESYGFSAKLYEGDMIDFQIPEVFDAVIIPYFSFMYVRTQEERIRLLQSVYEHLKPGGVFALDFDTSRGEVKEYPPTVALQGIHPLTSQVLLQTVQIRWYTQTLRVLNQINYRYPGEITVQSSIEATIGKEDMEALLQAQGFCVEAVYCDHNYTPYQGEAQCVLVAKKQG